MNNQFQIASALLNYRMEYPRNIGNLIFLTKLIFRCYEKVKKKKHSKLENSILFNNNFCYLFFLFAKRSDGGSFNNRSMFRIKMN